MLECRINVIIIVFTTINNNNNDNTNNKISYHHHHHHPTTARVWSLSGVMGSLVLSAPLSLYLYLRESIQAPGSRTCLSCRLPAVSDAV